MGICSVVEILRSVGGGRALLRTLGEVELRCTSNGDPIYSVGNSAILLSFWHQEQWYRLKCYTSNSPNRKAIYGSSLLEDELYVVREGREGEWIDILLEPWIEGVTLGQYIRQCAATGDRERLQVISSKFDALALDLLAQEWAHGDLTCENIIVDSGGELHLIDFDASYLPQFEGIESVELGTAAYQHPDRTTKHFDRTIDDYSIALISSALALIATDPTLYERYQGSEGLLFDPLEVVEGRSEIYSVALSSFAKVGDAISYNIAKMLLEWGAPPSRLYSLMRLKVEGIHPSASPTTIFRRDGAWGYLNEFGREAIPPLFDSALDFSESLAAVRLGLSWHYIDSRLKVAVNCSGCLSLKSVRGGVGRMQIESGEWVERPLGK